MAMTTKSVFGIQTTQSDYIRDSLEKEKPQFEQQSGLLTKEQRQEILIQAINDFKEKKITEEELQTIKKVVE